MTRGLRRFVGAPAATAGPRVRPGEQCEMCSERLDHGHSHVVNVESRRILCTCRACYLLFTHSGAGGGHHRAVPERYLHAPSFPEGAAIWESTGIPVGVVFVFRSSITGPAAFYPSPAGATKSLLPAEPWERALAGRPEFAGIDSDVEALLLNRSRSGAGEVECFLVPIDTCYHLVGLVRTHWRGFDGGTEAWQSIDEFFGRLRQRCHSVGAGDG